MREPLTPVEQLARWVRFGVLLVASLVLVWVLAQLREIVLPLIVALIFAYLLNPLVQALEARAVRRGVAVVLLTLAFTVGVGTLLLLAVPAVTGQVIELRQILPSQLIQARQTLARFEVILADDYPFLASYNLVELFAGVFQEKMGSVRMHVPQWIASHATLLVMTLLIPFFVFFLLRDGESWLQRVFDALPHRSVETVMSLVSEFNVSLGGYLRSLIVDAVAVGALVGVGLSAVGLNYALVIGLITGVGNFIPYLGPILGWLAAAAVALFQGGETAVLLLQVTLVVGAVKFLDDWLFQPLIVGHGAHVHPILVVLSVFVGGYAMGVVGMVIAVPVTVIVQVALRIGFERYRFAARPGRGRPLPPERVIV